MRFTAVFHDSDGRITSVQRNATENVIRGRSYVQADFSGDPDDFYVSGGEVIPKGEKPSSAHFFDYSSASWTLDLNEAKDQAWKKLNGIEKIKSTEHFRGTLTRFSAIS